MGRNDHQRTCGPSSLHALSWTRGILAESCFQAFTCYDRMLANTSLPRLTNCLLLPRHFLELDLLYSYAATGEQSIGHMINTKFALYFSQASFTFPTTLTKCQFILCSKICYYYFPSNLFSSFLETTTRTGFYSGTRSYLKV